MTCDDYQIAFDQQRAGAPPAISAAELDAHLAACAACTAYVSLSQKVSLSMMNTLSLSPPALDVDAMRARIAKFRRQSRLAPLVGAVVIAGSMFAQELFRHHNWAAHPMLGILSLMIPLIMGIIFYALTVSARRPELFRLSQLEARSGDELVVGLRAQLGLMIRVERRRWWAAPLAAAILLYLFFGFEKPSTAASVVFLSIDLIVLGVLPLSIIRYRRFVRERAQLN